MSESTLIRLLGSQEALHGKLDAVAPNWRRVIDHEKVIEANLSGVFDEVWLLRHLRDQFRSSVYKKVSEKGGEISEKVLEEGGTSIVSGLKDFGSFAYSEIEALLDIEKGVANLIIEYEENRQFGASGDVNSDLGWISRGEVSKLQESRLFWDKEMLGFFKEVVDLLDEVDSSRKSEWRDLKESHLDLFRRESDRALEEQRSILNKDFFGILRPKLESSGDPTLKATRDITLTSEEHSALFGRIKHSISLEICNQRKLRTSFVSAVTQILIGKSTPEELIEFIYSFDILTSEQKSTLKQFIVDGYVGFESTPESFFGTPPDIPSPSKIIQKCAKKIFVDGIFHAIQAAEDDHKERMNAVYESTIYKVCNGGWWAGIAHVASLGGCTSATLTAAVIDLVKGRLSGLSELRTIVSVIKFLIQLPPRITVCELFRRLFKEALEDALCDVVREALKESAKKLEKDEQ